MPIVGPIPDFTPPTPPVLVRPVPPLYLEPLPPMPLGLTTYGAFSSFTSSNPGTGPSCTHSGGVSGHGSPHDCHMIPEPSTGVHLFTFLALVWAFSRILKGGYCYGSLRHRD